MSLLAGVGPTSEKAKQEKEREEKRQPAVGLQWNDFSLLSVLCVMFVFTNPSKIFCHLLV